MQLPGGSTRIPPARTSASSVRSVVTPKSNIGIDFGISNGNTGIRNGRSSRKNGNDINESTRTISESECVCGSAISDNGIIGKNGKESNCNKCSNERIGRKEKSEARRKSGNDNKSDTGRRSSGGAGRFYRRNESADKERNGIVESGRTSRLLKERHHLVAGTRTNRRHRVTKHPQVLLASAPRRKVQGEE